jgi:hypothetical protein
VAITIKHKVASSAGNPSAGIKPGPASADPATAAPEGGAKKLASAPSEPPLKPAKRRRERKTERIDLRLAPSAKEFIEHVVDVSGVSPSNLLIRGAQDMLRDLETRFESDRLDPTMRRFRTPPLSK